MRLISSILKFLSLVFLCLQLTGCIFQKSYNSYAVKNSMGAHRYPQAEERLKRCLKKGEDPRCEELMNEIRKSGYSTQKYLKIKQKEDENEYAKKRRELNQKIEHEKILLLRNSENPWDLLRILLEINNGKISEIYPGEANELIKKAFFGFGECAMNANPDCMKQYASMILDGSSSLQKNDQKGAREKAIYWLNISARYGNKDARKILMSLQQPIPSPDLAMETLQKQANSIAVKELKSEKKALEQSAYYQKQMLSEQKRANFINAMNSFFPKTVTCSSNSVGNYTYIKCN